MSQGQEPVRGTRLGQAAGATLRERMAGPLPAHRSADAEDSVWEGASLSLAASGASPTGAPTFPNGSLVRIHSVRTNPALNGKQACRDGERRCQGVVTGCAGCSLQPLGGGGRALWQRSAAMARKRSHGCACGHASCEALLEHGVPSRAVRWLGRPMRDRTARARTRGMRLRQYR